MLTSPVDESLQKRALKWLSLTVFLLTACPLLNLRIGPVPIYAIDFLAFLTWYYASRVNWTRRLPLQGFVFLIFFAMIISELVAGLRLGTLLQPAYIIVRTTLAISLFFLTPKIIQTKSDLMAIIKMGLAGTLVTATLMIASSLPPTQSLVARYVFSHSFLTPSSNELVARFAFVGIAMRGHSLVGTSTISGAFLNVVWPMLFLLRTDQELSKVWKIVLVPATILIPIGIVVSYSRGAILGLLLVTVISILMNSNKIRQPIIIGIGLSILIFSWAGWDSQYFKFEWFENKVEYQLANPYSSIDTTERLFAYSEPIWHAMENPEFFFFGQGFARDKVSDNILLAGYDAATHAVFASAYYGYGMLAALAYVLLLIGAFWITWNYSWHSTNEFLNMFSRALLTSLFGFSSWFLLGHAAVSEPRGAMLLFFVFGLVVAQSNFADLPEYTQPNIFRRNSRRETQYLTMSAGQSSPLEAKRHNEL